MKKILLSGLLLSSVCFGAFAQSTPATATQGTRTEEYCMLMATQKLLSTKVIITIDYGQERKFFSDTRYKDAEGKVQSFNSVIDALNFMNSEKWEFVNAYVITVGGQNVYHYVMKRRIAA